MAEKKKVEELNRPSVDEYRGIEKIPVRVVLDNIRSSYNVGTIFRTSDAFLIEQILICGISAKPPHKEVLKTALGATDSVDWSYHEEIIPLIISYKEKGWKIISVEQAEPHLSLEDFSFQHDENYLLIFGHEVFGVQDEVIELSDACIEIPQSGTKHSLNIGVAAGMVLWEAYKQLHLKPD